MMIQRGAILAGTVCGAFGGTLISEIAADPWGLIVKAISDIGAIVILAWYLYYDVRVVRPSYDKRLDEKDQLLREFMRNCPCARTVEIEHKPEEK